MFLNPVSLKPTRQNTELLTAHSCSFAKSFFAISVIQFPLFRIWKDFVSEADFLELRRTRSQRSKSTKWSQPRREKRPKKLTLSPASGFLSGWYSFASFLYACGRIGKNDKFRLFCQLGGLENAKELLQPLFSSHMRRSQTFFNSVSLAFCGTPRRSYNRVSAILSRNCCVTGVSHDVMVIGR